MRAKLLFLFLLPSVSAAFAQPSTAMPSFDVTSVKPCLHAVGPDYNNQLTYTPNGITARNVTLNRLAAEAYHLQLNQILGPDWLSRNEYDVDARTAEPVPRERIALMLQTLLAQRFNLATHGETREMRVYELAVAKSGPKIHAVKVGETPAAEGGFHFHGDLRHFADLLAVQLTIPAPQNPNEPVRASQSPIPVFDKTGLQGTFDFNVDIRPELGTDMFASWQRALEDQLGLRIESRKGSVAVMVVDQASKAPTEN